MTATASLPQRIRAFRLRPEHYRVVTIVAAVLLGLIIVTGASVRLTGSGLGCPEWPNCADGSFTPTPELGVHGWIEFLNRMVTGLVSLAVMVAVLGALVRAPRRRDLTWLAVGLVIGVLVQAVLGALVVQKLLSPPFVMGHFLVSAVLLANAVVLVWRAGAPDGVPTPVRTSPLVHRTAVVVVGLASLVLVTGTIVTGAGPHSGDSGTAGDYSLRATRLDIPVGDAARVHAITVLVFLATILILLAVLVRDRGTTVVYRRVGLLLALVVAQGTVGYIQYFNDLPRGLVTLHVAGATVVFAAAVAVLLGCRVGESGPATTRERTPGVAAS